MEWTSRFSFFRRQAVIFLALCAVFACQLPGSATATLYAGKRKVINCGILMLKNEDGSTPSQPLTPHSPASFATSGVGDLFSLLEFRADLKPAGWSFENPYTQVDRVTGKKFDKNNPFYWLVDLRTTKDLSRMNVLYLAASGIVKLDNMDREKLRKFVDGGGVLWVDNTGTATTCLQFAPVPQGSFFIPYFSFKSATSPSYDIPWSRHHAILTMPYWLDDFDVTNIGVNSGNMCNGGLIPTMDVLPVEVLFPVVQKGSGADPSVSANVYGSGRIVATANFAAKGCFKMFPYEMSSLKLAYNIIAWSSSWTDLRKDPRHSGRSIDTLGGSSMVKMWSVPGTPPNGESGAVMYKNVAFYTSGATVYAVDIMPSEDLDNDGNPDDGVEDPRGSAYDGQDVIWTFTCPNATRVSSPSVVTMQDPMDPNKTVEAVLVLANNGIVYVLEAFPTALTSSKLDSVGRLVPISASSSVGTYSNPWNISGGDIPNPTPPIYVNGWFYAVAADGHLDARSPLLSKWNVGHTPTVTDAYSLPTSAWASGNPGIQFKAGPNFGYVSTSTSGAMVGTVYWCTSTSTGAASPQDQNDHILGVPVFVRNDRLRIKSYNKSSGTVTCSTTYSNFRIAPAPAPVISIASPLGSPVPIVSSILPTTVNGEIRFEISGELTPDAIVYADYSLDYINTFNAAMVNIRVPLQPPSVSGPGYSTTIPPTFIPATPAMGQDNMMYVTGTRTNPQYGSGGSIYGIRNEGNNRAMASQMKYLVTKWNYMLHSGVPSNTFGNSTFLQGLATSVLPIPGLLYKKPHPSSLDMSDIITALDACTIQSPQSFSSPVVAGDKVFVTVTGLNNTGGALLCLKANSDFVIRITENTGTAPGIGGAAGLPLKRPKRLYNTNGQPINIKLWQPNLLCGASGLGPTAEGVWVPENLIDREKGTITFTDFSQLKLLGSAGAGVMSPTNTFSTSLPVWVSLDEVEVPIDWSTWGPTNALASMLVKPMPQVISDSVDLSSWGNLLWYYAPPNCSGIHSSPVLIGDSVYFVTDDGYIYAVDAETGETNGGPMNLYDGAGGDWKRDTNFVRWADPIEGPAGNPVNYAVGNGLNVSPSGSNGVLLVPGPNGLCGYANPSILVADTNRIVEVDSSSAITWSLDAVQKPATTPTQSRTGEVQLPRRRVPINKPARARYLDTGQLLIVNSGANMVCRTDRSGNITYLGGTGGKYGLMAFDKFADPKSLLRPGQTLSLSSPNDAIIWQEQEYSDAHGLMNVTHCIVADSGNSRVVDLVYRFNSVNELLNLTQDPETGYYLPDLNWVSNTESKAERYVFECLQLVPNSGLGADIWAAISNYRVDPSTPNPQGHGGAVVCLKYRTGAVSGGSVSWNYADPNTGKIIDKCAIVDNQPLACPHSFYMRYKILDGAYGLFMIICDNRGVREVGPMNGGSTSYTTKRQLLDTDYRNLSRDVIGGAPMALLAPLNASSVQELPNGNWLIANSYSGSSTNGALKFNGEIFEYDFGSGSGGGSVTWCSPKIEKDGVLGWRQSNKTSYIFTQPRSAYRQY